MSDAKLIRGQLRQIVKEELPVIMTEEHSKEIKKIIDSRLSFIEKAMEARLADLEKRHADTMSYLIRQTGIHVGKKV